MRWLANCSVEQSAAAGVWSVAQVLSAASCLPLRAVEGEVSRED